MTRKEAYRSPRIKEVLSDARRNFLYSGRRALRDIILYYLLQLLRA